MVSTCLVTGGAGFIGCALSGALADEFERVVVLDNLHPQVHARPERPDAMDTRVEFTRGDVTDPSTWDALLSEVSPNTVVHLAAETGTGQSLTEASRHAMVNVVGTTQMLDAFVRGDHRPDRIILTSSRAVYGEGAWVDADGRTVYPGQRSRAMLESGTWDFPGMSALAFSSQLTTPVPTSVYGSTKLAQEHVLLSWCVAMDTTAVIFRLQNVYGPGQSLTNPYTGIVSLFAQKAKAGEVIPVYEDGMIVRDFVFIDDVVSALLRGVLDAPATLAHPYDIGSGQASTILELAEVIARRYGAPEPVINGMYRYGDVRHASCITDHARRTLAWEPKVMMRDGVGRLCDWIDTFVS